MKTRIKAHAQRLVGSYTHKRSLLTHILYPKANEIIFFPLFPSIPLIAPSKKRTLPSTLLRTKSFLH